jgi:hypothetical protein
MNRLRTPAAILLALLLLPMASPAPGEDPYGSDYYRREAKAERDYERAIKQQYGYGYHELDDTDPEVEDEPTIEEAIEAEVASMRAAHKRELVGIVKDLKRGPVHVAVWPLDYQKRALGELLRKGVIEKAEIKGKWDKRKELCWRLVEKAADVAPRQAPMRVKTYHVQCDPDEETYLRAVAEDLARQRKTK